MKGLDPLFWKRYDYPTAMFKPLKRIPFAISLGAVLAGLAAAQNAPPILFSAANSASYDETGIAQGSLFVVFGENIGPQAFIQVSTFPVPPQIGGTAITVVSGSTVLSCPMIYSESGQAAAILPSNTPLGRASLSLTYNGMPTPFPVMINVLPSSAGIYTLSSSGLGPGVFTAVDYSVKTFAATAKPGDTVTAWATGLGPINGPDNVLPQTFPNFPGVEVFVGAQLANVIYAGRSGCCSGVDEVSFQIPQGVTGCYVPVSIRSAGKISNFVTIAANAEGTACSDTAPTVPTSILNRAAQGQPIQMAMVAIGPTSILRGLGFNQRQYLADQLSRLLHVNVSLQDAAALIRAAQTHNRRIVNRTMAKYAAALKKLDAMSKAAIQAEVNLSQEGSVADFGQFNLAGVLAPAIAGIFPSARLLHDIDVRIWLTWGCRSGFGRGQFSETHWPYRILDVSADDHRRVSGSVRIDSLRSECSTGNICDGGYRWEGCACVQRHAEHQREHHLDQQIEHLDRESEPAIDHQLVGRRELAICSARWVLDQRYAGRRHFCLCRTSGRRFFHDSELYPFRTLSDHDGRRDLYRSASNVGAGNDPRL